MKLAHTNYIMKTVFFKLITTFALLVQLTTVLAGNGYTQTIQSSAASIIPGQTATVTSSITAGPELIGLVAAAQIKIQGGLTVVSCQFKDVTANQTLQGTTTTAGNFWQVNFTGLPAINSGHQYSITLVVKGAVMDAAGTMQLNNSSALVTAILYTQTDSAAHANSANKNITIQTYNTQNLLYNYALNTGIELDSTDAWSVAVVDYNGDKYEDLFFTDKRATFPNRLYKNNGNGTFTRITTGEIVTDLAQSVTSAWADIDNDGDLDVVVANNTQKPNYFYINNGNGTFTKNTTAGFAKEVGYYHHASWVDVNNDGKLELFLGNYWPTRFNELWKQDSQGNWVLWTDNLLSQTQGSGVGATWADYDNDGFQDLLLLNNDGGNNQLFRNTGNGNFVAVNNAITQHGGHSVGSTWGDIDNDGDMDLFISNASNMNNELYKNNGNGTFILVTDAAIVTDAGHSHGCAFADIDKDMDLDLFVSNDQGIKFLYINDGLGNFTRKTDEWPTANVGMSYAVQFADIDRDGDADMLLANHNNQRNFVFTANNNTQKYLTIKLVGVNSNKAAIGAKIRVKVGAKWQKREVQSQNGFGGQGSLQQLFGLGTACRADSVEILWPNGIVQKMRYVNANQNLIITEPNTITITGTAYYDANSNCQKNTGEFVLPNTHFKITPGNYHVYTGADGKFSINLPSGSYQLRSADATTPLSCSNYISFQVSNCGGSHNLGIIAMRKTCNGPGVSVTASTTAIRRGFPNKYYVRINNSGVAAAQNVSVTASLPAQFAIDSANVQWASNTNNQLSWVIPSIAAGEEKIIVLYFNPGLQVMPDDMVESTFRIQCTNDCNMNDNGFTDLQRVYGSIDPNDLLAFPDGTGENHAIDAQQDVTYRIRFQNVGNYAAEFVTVVDTLPEGLDISELTNMTSSHRVEVSNNGNIVTFYFPDIQLPDSTTDFEGSNGYVQFTVKQKTSNATGTLLANSAAIQFDYNEFIITNRVTHTVVNNTSGGLKIYPNPTNSVAHISLSNDDGSLREIHNISIADGSGNIVQQNPSVNDTNAIIDLSNYPQGIYYVLALDSNGKKVGGKVFVQ